MKRRLMLSSMAATAVVATGCAGPSLENHVQTEPVLDLRQYFNGVVDAWGMFTDRSGQVVKSFTVVMHCNWQGDEGVLDEDFVYSDGSTQKRIWHLTHQGEGRYVGRADDVIGEASGRTRGNAFNWAYTLALPVSGRVWHVQMDDWMYLMSSQVMLNKARMSKWGIFLGEVTLSFTKRA